MKKLLLASVCMLAISVSMFAIDVPKAIADAFAKKFPAATNINGLKKMPKNTRPNLN
jgi:hypothetical protein